MLNLYILKSIAGFLIGAIDKEVVSKFFAIFGMNRL